MQGDILWPKDELKSLFKEVHPHFCDPKYIAFIVTTQSCDLVCRDNKPCKADYINLAVVRDLESCLSQLLDNVCEKVVPGVYLKASKRDAYQLLTRILNQNEQAMGLFYLHPDVDTMGISDYAVALLRLSIAVRAKEHYGLLQKVRTGCLNPEFRNKLGWLVGNLYSRIGTPDWRDQKDGDKQMKALIDEMIDCEFYLWVSKSSVKAASKAGICIDKIPATELSAILEEHQPPPYKEQVADAAKEEITKVVSGLQRQILEELEQRVALEPKNREAMRETIVSRLNEIPTKVRNRLVNNPVVNKALSRDELEEYSVT
jgi:hypothetical protein